MRLVYLDEAGTDRKAPWLCVAGVIVHGDQQWPEIDKRIGALIEKYVPPEKRPGFAFHATDIFHGSGDVFDRRKPEWADQEKRISVLLDLAGIIEDLKLPVVLGHYEKEKYGIGVLSHQEKPEFKSKSNPRHGGYGLLDPSGSVACEVYTRRVGDCGPRGWNVGKAPNQAFSASTAGRASSRN